MVKGKVGSLDWNEGGVFKGRVLIFCDFGDSLLFLGRINEKIFIVI